MEMCVEIIPVLDQSTKQSMNLDITIYRVSDNEES